MEVCCRKRALRLFNKINNIILTAGKLQHVFEEYTSFHVSDLTFFPSERGHSYDFFATSADRNDLLYINLASGKIEMIEGRCIFSLVAERCELLESVCCLFSLI